jgi:MoaA/NifB/PqqE/SkfB family radical SAM enzyme
MNSKEFLLKESKVFCMSPWVHIHTSPTGTASACCIAKTTIGNSNSQNLEELVNSSGMKQLRLDMLNEKFNPTCVACYSHEAGGVRSSRDQYYQRFSKHFDEVIANTKEDGHLDNFKMRYFDIRFNNICNFKCRTCNAEYSTQWEQEDIKRKLPYARIYPKNNSPRLLGEIMEHIPYMEYAYFAGGEPLITEEHYIVLEEMIKQGRTDITLVYNSNASNLKFKSKDIIQLWNQFSKPIEFSASIDHVGERAEYIRSGTNWGEVENNLLILKSLPNLHLTLNTVNSVFNYLTLREFYTYLIDKKIYEPPPGRSFSLYPMTHPEYFSAQILPLALKQQAKVGINYILHYMTSKGFTPHQTTVIQNTVNWTESSNQWELYKDAFRAYVLELDKVRGEDFIKVFPELASLMD